VPTSEACNGIDDDCDGVTDEPVTDVGEGCGGCVWSTFEGRHYVLCPGDASSCPGGTQLVTLQSPAEHDFVASLLSVDEYALLGLTQQAGAPTCLIGWSWDQTGMPIPWDEGQPDDSGVPDFVEDDVENCGFIQWNGGDSTGVHDAPCLGFATYLACEESADECVEGAACEVADGCLGTFDCSVPGGQCVAAAAAEACNGLDDDCNAVADDDNACDCTEISAAGNTYRLCLHLGTYEAMHCGEGFVPAMPKSAAELSAILAATSSYDGYIRIGVFQSPQATAVDEGWLYHDATPFDASLWDASDPDDGMSGGEMHAQDCGMLRNIYPAVHDYDCFDPNAYLCQSL
jgi:hypothetical protein